MSKIQSRLEQPRMDRPYYRYRFDDVEVDEAQFVLRVKDAAVKIEPRPLQLLIVLLQNAGATVTKSELFKSIWDSRIDNENALQNAVGKIRRAMSHSAERIETVTGLGYRFVGSLQRVAVGAPVLEHSALHAGATVQGRTGFRLELLLGGTRHQVWRARGPAGEARVFKFALDKDGLASLKRERMLSKYLHETLGPRPAFCFSTGENFEHPPCFLEFDDGGLDLMAWDGDGQRLAQMSIDERVALLLPVVEAVADAHEVAVLHKDIKPSNILVYRQADGSWATRLTDFGCGHALDVERIRALGLTVMGITVDSADAEGWMGTLPFLAPELLAGKPATLQTDLYALGQVLFRVAVADLHRPLVPGWERDVPDELLREDIASATDGDPRTRLPGARPLLDRLRSLALRRVQRVEAAQKAEQTRIALAELARRRARRPWAVAAIIFLGVGMVASLALYERSTQALRTAQEEARRAAAISNFLHRDVLEAADAVTVGAIVRQQSMLDILRKSAKAAPIRFAGQQIAEAVVHRRLAETFMKLAIAVDARAEIDRSIRLLQQAGVNPDDEELLLSRFLKSRILVWQERLEEGAAELSSAENVATSSRLDIPSALAYAAKRARFELDYSLRKNAQALATSRQLVQVAQQAFAPGSQEQVDARQRVAYALWQLGNEADARSALAELKGPPFNLPNAALEFEANMLLYQAAEQRKQGRYPEALQSAAQARDLMLQAGDSTNQFILGWCDMDASSSHESLGDFGAAMNAARSALDLYRGLLGDDHQYTIFLRLKMAQLTLEQGKAAEALAQFDAVDRQQRRVYNNGRPWRGWVDFGRGWCLLELGRYADAIKVLQEVDGASLQDSLETTDAAERLAFTTGRALVRLGRKDEGKRLMAQALEAMETRSTWPWLKKSFREQLHRLG